jgi:hypothetical protein
MHHGPSSERKNCALSSSELTLCRESEVVSHQRCVDSV